MRMKKLRQQAEEAQVTSSEQQLKKIQDLDEEDDKGDESSEDEEEDVIGGDMDQELEKPYPEECRVLDIMKEKYLEAVRFFNDTNDKKQLNLAIKEY